MLKAYWKVQFLPATLFSRDKLKSGIDQNYNAVRFLDRYEVEYYIQNNRLNQWKPKQKNWLSRTSFYLIPI